METKQIFRRNGMSFEISGKIIQPKSHAYSMEFYINGPKQHVLDLNLSKPAAIFLAHDLNSFDPHAWLWETGCDMIKNAAEYNALINGDFTILERHVRIGRPRDLKELKDDHMEYTQQYLDEIKKIRSVIITWTQLPQTEHYAIKESAVTIDGDLLIMPDIGKSLRITTDNIVAIANGFHQELIFGAKVMNFQFLS